MVSSLSSLRKKQLVVKTHEMIGLNKLLEPPVNVNNIWIRNFEAHLLTNTTVVCASIFINNFVAIFVVAGKHRVQGNSLSRTRFVFSRDEVTWPRRQRKHHISSGEHIRSKEVVSWSSWYPHFHRDVASSLVNTMKAVSQIYDHRIETDRGCKQGLRKDCVAELGSSDFHMTPRNV